MRVVLRRAALDHTLHKGTGNWVVQSGPVQSQAPCVAQVGSVERLVLLLNVQGRRRGRLLVRRGSLLVDAVSGLIELSISIYAGGCGELDLVLLHLLLLALAQRH